MERQPVESSLIRSVGYDLTGSILEIELIDPHRLYTFYDVPFSVYDELMDASSKGKYFNEFIRDLYAYEVTDGPRPPGPGEPGEPDATAPPE